MRAETVVPLIHIGYHKTGTSWLQRELFTNQPAGFRHLGDGSRHPVRRFYRDAPLAFDAAAVFSELEPALRSAEEDGVVPVLTNERLSGQAFSGGYDVKQIADRLNQTFPAARILMVIREQRAMIASTYKQYVKAGGACSPAEFLHPRTDRAVRVPQFDLGYFEYDRLIAYYRSLFGDDRVLALPYEQLVDDARGFVVSIAAFVERQVPEAVLDALPYDRRENKSPSALTIAVMRRLNRWAPRSELNPSPLAEFRSVRRTVDRLKKTDPLGGLAGRRLGGRSESSLRRAVADAVANRYRESNRRTGELIGADLGRYGWSV